MSAYEIQLLQQGMMLMMAIYSLVNYIRHRKSMYLINFIFVVNTVLVCYYLQTQLLVEVSATISSCAYLFLIGYYTNRLKEDTKSFNYLLWIAIGFLVQLVLYFITPPLPVFILYCLKASIILLTFFTLLQFLTINKSQGRYYWISFLFFLTVLVYSFIFSVYNSTSIDISPYKNVWIEGIIVLQIFFVFAGIIDRYYHSDEEKKHIQSRFFLQMQENELQRLRIKKIREDIINNLHDDIGTQISVINALSQGSLHWLDIDQNKSLKYLHDIEDAISNIASKTEQIVFEGNSKAIVDESHLSRQLEEILMILFQNTNINYTTTLPPDKAWNSYSSAFKNQLFLIFKELLVNIKKHAQASELKILIKIRSNNFYMMVSDNGIGFDTKQNHPGHGHHSLRKRVETLNGKLDIKSSPDKGTVIEVKI